LSQGLPDKSEYEQIDALADLIAERHRALGILS